MTLPNKLTLVRIVLVPVMVVVAFIPYLRDTAIFAGCGLSIANFINIIIFALASITDFLDGKIARKYNLVTTFGKFADPLADKMLVTSAMVILCTQLYGTNYWWFLPAFGLIIILCRDLIVDGVRLVAVQGGKVIPAGWLGKIKTFVTMFALVFLFLWQIEFGGVPVFGYIGMGLMYVGIVFTILSGAEYFYKNRSIIFESI